ncbi:P-loop NTPase fold protein [uncultured Methanosphaera sp.]|uniref:KAP family P-loop NTPase fold protein n=1 Tax=uncultured Methanosphaera sp. TaxID=262501 RepID=UPI00259734DB|nr:P-loop NTPase fold protein [uncultured Methanosphaera sp.]
MYSVIYEDKPIKSIDEDLLNRKHIVEKLNHLISNNYSETFTIGLQGGWGLGKTSLINMVKNELSEEILILDFDPWIISNKSDIEETFFKEFKSILEENVDESTLKYITKYQKEIIHNSMGILDIIFSLFSNININLFSTTYDNLERKNSNVNFLKNKINEKLSEIPFYNRILIIIDDVDRLPKEEIQSIFKLVASSANFNNLTFLIAYDEKVVVSALNNTQEDMGKEYLEKIINIQVDLPELDRDSLRKIFFKKLSTLNEIININENSLNSLVNMYPNIRNYFSNIRQLNRFFNKINTDMIFLVNEINIADYLIIKIFQENEFELYNLIRENKFLLIYDKTHSLCKDEFKLFEEDEKNGSKNSFYSKLKQIMDSNVNIKSLMINLFPCMNVLYMKNYMEPYHKSKDNKKLICSKNYFEKYFLENISPYDISDKEIYELCEQSNEEKINELIKYYDNQNKINILLDKLDYMDIDISNLNLMIKSIITLGDQFKPDFQMGVNYTPINIRYTLFSLLNKLGTNNSYNILVELIESLDFISYTLFDLIYYEFYENKNNKETFFNEEQIKNLSEEYLNILNTKFNKGTLLSHQYAYDMLSCIKVMDEKYFNIFMNEVLNDNQLLIEYIQIFIHYNNSIKFSINNTRDTQLKNELIFNYENMIKLYDIEQINTKIKNMKLNENNKLFIELFNKYYSKYSENNN